MATDRSLATLLRALLTPSNGQDVNHLLGSATSLLTLLTNPLNITLLTSHLLSAPAIWQHPNGILTSRQILGVFNSASMHTLRDEHNVSPSGIRPGREGLPKEDWVKAVVKGADEKSPRWKHLLVLGGILSGFEGNDRLGLSPNLRRMLESAVVKATNLALTEEQPLGGTAINSVCLVLAYCMDILSPFEKQLLDHGQLLQALIEAMFFSSDCLHSGYFMSPIDMDIVQAERNTFSWSPKSQSYRNTLLLATSPLFGTLGSLSRLAAMCVEQIANAQVILKTVDQLRSFTMSLEVQWRNNKLSEIDISEEREVLTAETYNQTLPLLWQTLKSTLFAIVTMQRSLLGHLLADGRMPIARAPTIAVNTLHSLRHLQFITARIGQNALTMYNFVYMTSVDILANDPRTAESFIHEISPVEMGRIPVHPQVRNHDLFFMNVAEHFSLWLSPRTNDKLLVNAVMPYLAVSNDSRLLEMFEAAHSVMLAIFSAPHNHEVSAKYLPFYIDTLFNVFPSNLSPRQFRLAIKTLVRVTSPPSAVSEIQPLLSSTLLEMVLTRSTTASRETSPALNPHEAETHPPVTEQCVMILTLVDSLSVLPTADLEDWLPLVAAAINCVTDPAMVKMCKDRFWEVLSSGEMDVARSERCVAWWNCHGGREALIGAQRPEEKGPFMSGALQVQESKL